MQSETFYRQECIPVGCVLPAAVAIWGALHQAPPGPGTPQDQTPQDQASPLWDQAPPRTRHPPGTRPPGTRDPGTRHPLGPGTPLVDRHTPVNILPCPKLRLWAVIM